MRKRNMALAPSFSFDKFWILMIFGAIASGCGVGLDTTSSGFFGGQLYPDVLWSRTSEDGASGATIGNDNATHGIAIDLAGNIYVTNYTNQGMDGRTLIGAQDFFITKYAQGGARQWTVEDGAVGATVNADGIVADSFGNIYVSGITNVALGGQSLHGSQDFFITKYNSNGVRQWTIEDGAGGATAIAGGIAQDSSANIYLVGLTNVAIDGQTLHGAQDFFITKYDTNGSRKWTVENGAATANIGGISIVVDPSGNVSALGDIRFAALDGQTYYGGRDYFLTQYNSSGVRQWTVEDGVGGATIYVGNDDLAIDSGGNLYISGQTSQALDGQSLHGSADFFISKYSSSGIRQWTVEDGVLTFSSYGEGVVTDSSANVYLTGYVHNGLDGNAFIGTQDLFLTKYNSSGVRQWTVEDGVSGATDEGYALVSDLYNNIYVTGYTNKGLDGNALAGTYDYFIAQYSSSGTRE